MVGSFFGAGGEGSYLSYVLGNYLQRTIMNTQVDAPDWSKIPAPTDDGVARHLTGMRIPSVSLPATDGTAVDLSVLTGLVVVYVYPRTGRPGWKTRMVGT